MTNTSRRYYERELGAGMGPNPSMNEAFGYSEPLRRFIQRESFEPQANEIPNTMPSWLPGDDYMTNFKVGDPYVRIDDGYARLPGAGYEALIRNWKEWIRKNIPTSTSCASCRMWRLTPVSTTPTASTCPPRPRTTPACRSSWTRSSIGSAR